MTLEEYFSKQKHLIDSTIDNITNQPIKRSDKLSYQKGFTDAYLQINAVLEKLYTDTTKEQQDICAHCGKDRNTEGGTAIDGFTKRRIRCQFH